MHVGHLENYLAVGEIDRLTGFDLRCEVVDGRRHTRVVALSSTLLQNEGLPCLDLGFVTRDGARPHLGPGKIDEKADDLAELGRLPAGLFRSLAMDVRRRVSEIQSQDIGPRGDQRAELLRRPSSRPQRRNDLRPPHLPILTLRATPVSNGQPPCKDK